MSVPVVLLAGGLGNRSAGFLKLGSFKARRHLGWSFDQPLDATADWRRADVKSTLR